MIRLVRLPWTPMPCRACRRAGVAARRAESPFAKPSTLPASTRRPFDKIPGQRLSDGWLEEGMKQQIADGQGDSPKERRGRPSPTR